MIQQLVMYEEELQQINHICEILHRDSNAKAVLVIDKNGQAIAQAGDTQLATLPGLSSLLWWAMRSFAGPDNTPWLAAA